MESLENTCGSLGIERIQNLFVNAFLVDTAEGHWVLVDAGLPGYASVFRNAAEERYGPDSKPDAIILTHGHFDHVGSLEQLAQEWDVPIYCHQLELPYLTGKSDYPPQDPTVGGAGAFLSRGFPNHGYDYGERVAALPAGGSVPFLPEWRWIHTPGHTPGHVSLWRERDRTLISGDAVITMDVDSWLSQLTHKRDLCRPPTYFTADWSLAHESVRRLAQLEPLAIFSGHGRVMRGEHVPNRLKTLASHFPIPSHGRYVASPAQTDERGVVALPAPAPDPLPARLAGAAVVGLGLGLLVRGLKSRRKGQTGPAKKGAATEPDSSRSLAGRQ